MLEMPLIPVDTLPEFIDTADPSTQALNRNIRARRRLRIFSLLKSLTSQINPHSFHSQIAKHEQSRRRAKCGVGKLNLNIRERQP
jgi:hypothetical protein